MNYSSIKLFFKNQAGYNPKLLWEPGRRDLGEGQTRRTVEDTASLQDRMAGWWSRSSVPCALLSACYVPGTVSGAGRLRCPGVALRAWMGPHEHSYGKAHREWWDQDEQAGAEMGRMPCPISPSSAGGVELSAWDGLPGGLRPAADRRWDWDWDSGAQQGGELHGLTGTVVESAPSWKKSRRVLKPPLPQGTSMKPPQGDP